MPALISLTATMRLTGSVCWAFQTLPMPPSPIGSMNLYGPMTVSGRSAIGSKLSVASSAAGPRSRKLSAGSCALSNRSIRARKSSSPAHASSRWAARSVASSFSSAVMKIDRSLMAFSHAWRSPLRLYFEMRHRRGNCAKKSVGSFLAARKCIEAKVGVASSFSRNHELRRFLSKPVTPQCAVAIKITRRNSWESYRALHSLEVRLNDFRLAQCAIFLKRGRSFRTIPAIRRSADRPKRELKLQPPNPVTRSLPVGRRRRGGGRVEFDHGLRFFIG